MNKDKEGGEEANYHIDEINDPNENLDIYGNLYEDTPESGNQFTSERRNSLQLNENNKTENSNNFSENNIRRIISSNTNLGTNENRSTAQDTKEDTNHQNDKLKIIIDDKPIIISGVSGNEDDVIKQPIEFNTNQEKEDNGKKKDEEISHKNQIPIKKEKPK